MLLSGNNLLLYPYRESSIKVGAARCFSSVFLHRAGSAIMKVSLHDTVDSNPTAQAANRLMLKYIGYLCA